MIANSPFSQSSEWVEARLGELSIDRKIGQLLSAIVHPGGERLDLDKELGGIEPGSVYLMSSTAAQMTRAAAAVQQHCSVPVAVTADFEHGAGRTMTDVPQFPEPMGIAATGDSEAAYRVGRAAALQGRACGVHWALGPVVDINANPHNPITNTRAFSDETETVVEFSGRMIRGMQDHGLAACAKHFPGDGYDDRDQHNCTSVNPLSRERWLEESGRAFTEAIHSAGVWSIMIGHIALPAFDPGDGQAPPATLSRKLLTGLLREELGFDGVIMTDAMNMGGVTSWGSRETTVLGAILAGCDVILFSDPPRDFKILKDAFDRGELTEARINASVRRILRLKEMLGLHEDAGPRPLAPEAAAEIREDSRRIAEWSVTLVRDDQQFLPLNLTRGTRALVFHFRSQPRYNVDGLDKLLAERGVEVCRVDEDHLGDLPDEPSLRTFDAVIVALGFCPSWGTGRIRLDGVALRALARLVNLKLPNTVVISFGSPYHLYEFPRLPCYINAYSIYPPVQEAVVCVLSGEIPAAGRSPVDLGRPAQIKACGVLGAGTRRVGNEEQRSTVS